MAVYAISGITLIFRDTDFLKSEKQVERQIKPNVSNEELGRELRIRDLKVEKEEGPVADIVEFGNRQWTADAEAVVVLALAVAFVLLTFGSAVGLTAVSPWTSTRASVAAVSIGAAFWMILAHIWAFGLGGYFAGRMRHRHTGAPQLEVEFRDGAHDYANDAVIQNVH